MTARHDATAYKITLKGFTDEQLFSAWSVNYDAQHTEHVALVIAEMNARNAKIVGAITL